MRGLSLFAKLTKIDEIKHEVTGVLAEEAPDKSGEIFDYESSKPYFRAWNEEFAKATEGKSLGNLREMHQAVAIGKFIAVDYSDDDKQITVTAKVVDRQAWNKVVEGVYTGFSIGGQYVKSWRDGEFVRYTADPSEGSLVDNPCMYGAHFTAIKTDGTEELRKFSGARTENIRNQEGAEMEQKNEKQAVVEPNKVAKLEEVERLAKTVTDQEQRVTAQADEIASLSKAVETLTAMLEKLLGQPENPKVALKAVAVAKEEDHEKRPESNDPLSLIKRSHASPVFVPAGL
jgi:hypothetical protein